MPGRIISAMLIMMIVAILYAGLNIFGKNIVCLNDGRFIEADEAWHIGSELYYVTGESLDTLPASSVKRVIRGDYGIRNVPALLTYYFTEKEEIRLGLMTWMAGAAGLTFLFFLMTGTRRKSGGPHRLKSPAASGRQPRTDNDAPAEARLEFEFGIDIVRFFLEVFRYQTGASKSAPAHITSVERDRSGNYIYRLHVRHHGQWHSRRMTIGPIGEGTRSKSSCYYVIFDDHMVIKIPPEPVTDFAQYIASIRGETRIADKIAPRECLVPRIATILRRIYRFPGESTLAPDQLDDRYLTLLESREELRQYLKIGNTHAYFMDLARYFFLGPVAKGMHDTINAVANEILRDPDIICDRHEFASRYGPDAEAPRRQAASMLADFERRSEELLLKHHLDTAAYQYRHHAWFAAGLAAGAPGSPDFPIRLAANIEKELPRMFRKELLALLGDLFSSAAPITENYGNVIGRYTRILSLARNEPKMNSIVSNLLDLLFWTGSQGVAIRDLKPDNLIIAGDPELYPVFLNSPDKFNIGLIDLETAVDFAPGEAKKIDQPLLGGSLQYATPSNFFPNEIIDAHFDDLPRIFSLQDWYAAIAIIFELIAGELLFVKAGRLLGGKINAIDRLAPGANSVADFFRETSMAFWTAAAEELSAGLSRFGALAKGIRPTIPVRFRQRLKQELEITVESLRKSITRDIEAQSIFRVDPRQQQLLDFSMSRLEKRLDRWRNDAAHPEVAPQVRVRAVTFLENLMGYHTEVEEADRYLRMLDSGSDITAEDLMRMMFFVVRCAMRIPDQFPGPKRS